jgi:hypothetical protein
VELGSICQGGAVTLSAPDVEKVVFDECPNRPFITRYISFFRGESVSVMHSPVTAGVQIMLEYDLCFSGVAKIINPGFSMI